MVDERAFDLHGADAVARDVEYIVHATQNPEVALLVTLRAVAGEVHVLPLAPVDLAVALVVAPDGAQHTGPRLRDGEIAAADFHFFTLAVEEHRFDAGEGHRGRTRLRRRHTGQRCDHDAAGLRLPPRVDDGTALAANVLLIPHPRFGIDGLTDRPEQSQLRQVVARGQLGAPLHERADRRRRRVENGDAVLRADGPEPVFAGMIGSTLVHHLRNAERERPVYDIRMARDPADIGGAPEHVRIFEIEYPLGRRVYVGEIAAGRMQNAFWVASRARRVQDVERILGIHRFGGTLLPRALHQLRPPKIAPCLERHRLAGATQHDRVLDGRRVRERIVGILFQRHDRAAAVAAAGSDQDFRAGIVDPGPQRPRGEPAGTEGVHPAA